jgi:hypothetical protein
MFRNSTNRFRFTAVAVAAAASMLAACGSEQSNGPACSLELAPEMTDAQLQHVVQALRASTDPCGLQGAMRAEANQRSTPEAARSAELVSIDRGDAMHPYLRISFAVAARSE